MYLQIKNLSKSIKQTPLIKNAELSMFEGENLTIVGNSGCGKSTFLKILSGLDNDYDGEFTLDNVLMNDVKAGKRPISLMFQEPILFPHLNMIDNVAFPLKCLGLNKGEQYKRSCDVLESMKIGELANRFVYELSGGQKQRVALARAVIQKPKLLLLDEPFANLDLTLGREIMSFMKQIIEDNKTTTIFVTHNYEEAKLMSKRLFVFDNCEISEDFGGLADEFFGDGVYLAGEFVSMENLFLNKQDGLPITILQKISFHGVPFVSFYTDKGIIKLIKAPNEEICGQWYIKRKGDFNA